MPSSKSSAVQMSTTLTWLEDRRLITTDRVRQQRRITLLADDGSGAPYRNPGLGSPGSRVGYLKLPFSYWLDGWHTSLDLSAAAVLLIGLSLPKRFSLPQHHGADWYGISRDTIRRGLRTLQAMGLISYRNVAKPAPAAPGGVARDRLYTLTGQFEIEDARQAKSAEVSRLA